MMKKIFLLTILTLCSGCWGESHNPLSEVNIRASRDVQVKVIEATKQFGERNGFKVDVSNNLPREGRLIAQILLTRPDGVMVITSNFMNAEVLETDFYAEKPGEGWRTVKEKWLEEMRTEVGSQGQIIDVILEEMPKNN